MVMDRLFTGMVWGVGIVVILFIVGLLLLLLKNKGLPLLSWDFLYGVPSEIEEGGGIGPALFNSFYVLICPADLHPDWYGGRYISGRVCTKQ